MEGPARPRAVTFLPTSGIRRALVVPWLVLLTLPGTAPDTSLSREYETALRRYRSGDREGAIGEVRAWRDGRLRSELTAIAALTRSARSCPDCAPGSAWPRVPLLAALMLHTDCALEARRRGEPPGGQESAAVLIAGLMRDDAALRGFARRWYGAMAGLAESDNRWSEALDWAERGLRDHPGSPGLLLVRGSIEETMGVLLTPREEGEAPADLPSRRAQLELLHRREVRGHLEKARRTLRAAVDADPRLDEARLRLGRLAWRLGEKDEARSELREVLSRRHDDATAFLAHLFLGRLEEDEGRLGEAARCFEAAVALEPRSQSAHVALSHVRLRQGDAAAARREAGEAVKSSGYRRQPDPLWLYAWGPAADAEVQLEQLRREASP